MSNSNNKPVAKPTFRSTRHLLDTFPGPFAYKAGTNGVDKTFDVYCVSTGQTIVSSTYWHEREPAEVIAFAITHALNRHFYPLRSLTKRYSKLMLWMFPNWYPRPYKTQIVKHSSDHYEIGLACINQRVLGFGEADDQRLVIGVEDSGVTHEVLELFHWLGCILNKHFSKPIRNVR